jgi:argininosuccinate lyase
MQGFHSSFREASADLLNLERSLAKRDLVGGTSQKRVSEALDVATRHLELETQALEDAGLQIEGPK